MKKWTIILDLITIALSVAHIIFVLCKKKETA